MPSTSDATPPESVRPEAGEEWVIWNGSMGILAMATIGRVEGVGKGREAWLAPPYEAVGPFNLSDLQTTGCITFAACMVMSRLRWQADQVALRAAAQARRREAQERDRRRNGHDDGSRRRARSNGGDERQHRLTLNLPAEGKLDPPQIKAAFRRLAQKAHPDAGGSHEQFIRLTEARNALLDLTS